MIEQIQARLGLDGTAFKKGLTSAEADWKRFTSGIGDNLKSAFSFAVAFESIRYAISSMVELKRKAEDLGASTEFVQTFERLTQKFGGTAEQADTALIKLAETIGQARTEGGAAAEKFSRFGISLYDINGLAKTNEEVLKDVSDAYRNQSDAATKAALAIEFFGKSGRNINNVLELGGNGIDAYTEKMKRLGLVVSDFSVRQISELKSNLSTLGTGGILGNLIGGFIAMVGAIPRTLGQLSGGASLREAILGGALMRGGRPSVSRATKEEEERNRSAQQYQRNLEEIQKYEEQIAAIAKKERDFRFENASDAEKMKMLDEEMLELYKTASDVFATELERRQAGLELAQKEVQWKKIGAKIDEDAAKAAEKNEKIREDAAQEHMGRMDKLNELLKQRKDTQETVADRARFSMEELSNANLRGVSDPSLRADIVKAREVRDLMAKGERERLSGAAGGRERAMALFSKADAIRSGISSLKSDERLTSIDKSLLEMKENEAFIKNLYVEAGIKVRPVFAK